MAIDLARAFPEPAPGTGRPLARLFGIRHLSPAAADHLRAADGGPCRRPGRRHRPDSAPRPPGNPAAAGPAGLHPRAAGALPRLPLGGLAEVIRYGSVRQFNPEPLRPLLGQLFLRAMLQLRQACLCDDAAAKGIGDGEENARRRRHGDRKDRVFQGPAEVGVRRALRLLDRVAGELAEHVDAGRWYHELEAVAAADNLNPFLSGLAGAMLLEKGRTGEEELAREVSRRLSPGVPAELGAGWFEGLVSYDRLALFSRLALWRQLDAYLGSLDEDAFRNALVYLRWAFSDFTAPEIRRVVSNLVEVSGAAAEQLRDTVDTRLRDEEARKLQELLGGLDL